MSTTIDQRVVEMQFDNKHFEQNVQTSISTLDKLKKSLKLDDAAKGFDNVSSAAKKVDMTGLGNGVETVRQRFSALEVMGVTALANITNSAVNAGKRMLSAITIDPIKTGFSEYETQINATQTILANVKHKGKTLEDVNRVLDELNTYADQTIYNFTEMTRNIGLFVNAGVGLEESASAIKGFSNAAAMAGTDATKTAGAMYQLSQAMSAGSVKLRDWMSLEQANITGERFQETIKMTAKAHGIAIDDMIEKEGSLRETLKDGWLTADLMSEALNHYTLSLETMSEEEIEANRQRLKSLGYTEDQIDKLFELGTEATNAATKIKTFTQLWGVLQESAQSGWAKTWKLIIGDFEEAQELLTPLGNVLTGIIDKMSDARNSVLEALGLNGWDNLKKKLEGLGVSSDQFEEKIKDALKAAGYDVDELITKYGSLRKALQKIPDGIQILKNAFANLTGTAGKFADKLFDISGISRILGFGAVGEDVKQIQTALEKLGYTLEKFGVDGIIGPETTAAIKAFQEAAGIKADGVVGPETLEALEKVNLVTTELTDENKELLLTYEDLQAALNKKSGRELFMESLKNIGNGLLGIFKALKVAWDSIFPPRSAEQKAASIYKILEVINALTAKLRLTTSVTDENGNVITKLNDNGKKLMRTFKGIFAIFDIVATIIAGPLRIAFKIVGEILKYFDLNILDVTAAIGDFLVMIHDWFEGLFDISGILEVVVPWVSKCAKAISEWFKSINVGDALKKFVEWLAKAYNNFKKWLTAAGESDTVFGKVIRWFGSMAQKVRDFFRNFDAIDAFKKFIKLLQNGVGAVRNWFTAFKDSEAFKVASDIIAGLAEGLKTGASRVWNAAVEMAKGLWQAVKDFLGIHSPSTLFITIGAMCILGLIAGLSNGGGDIVSAVKWLFNWISEGVEKGLNSPIWDGIAEFFKGAWGILVKIVTSGYEGLKSVFEPIIKWFQKLDIGAIVGKLTAIGIALGSVWFLKQIGDFIGGMGRFLDGLGDIGQSLQKGLNSLSLALKAEAMKSFATSLLIMVGAIAIMTMLNLGKAAIATVLLGGIITAMIFLVKEMGKVDPKRSIASFALMILSVSGAMLAIAYLCKILEPISWGNLAKAGAALVVLTALIAGLVFVAHEMSSNMKVLSAFAALGNTLMKIGITIGILAIALKIIAGISDDSLVKAGRALAQIGILVGALVIAAGFANKLSTGSFDKFGATMLSIGGVFLMLAVTMKILGGMTYGEIFKAQMVMEGFIGIVILMITFSAIAGAITNDSVKDLGTAMAGIGGAFIMMAVAMKILAGMDETEMQKAMNAITGLGLIIAGMILATRMAGPNELKGMALTLFSMAACVAILAGICVILGLIDEETLYKGLAAVGALSLFMTLLVSSTKNAQNATGTLWALTAAIAIMAAAIIGLTFVDQQKVWSAVGAIGVLMLVFGELVGHTKNAGKAVGTLIVLTVAIGLMGGILIAMSALKVENALPNAAALSLVMLAMAGVLTILQKIGVGGMKPAYKAMLALTAMVAPMMVFAAAIRGVQAMGIDDSVIKPIAVIGAVVGAMALLMVPLAAIGKLAGWQSLIGVLALTAMVAPLLAFAGSIRWIQSFGIDASILDTITYLTKLMAAMTLLLIPLSIIGVICGAAMGAPFLGILALAAMAAPLLLFAKSIEWIGGMKISGGLPFIKDLVELMDAMTTMLVKVALVAPLALMAVAAIGALVGVITAFGAIVTAVGWLVENIDGMQSFIDTGIPIMVALAEGVGEMIGKFTGAIAGEIIALLPPLGEALTDFMKGAADFIESASDLDESLLTGVGYLAGAIALLCAADLLDNISTFMGFGEDFSGLGTKLSDFIENVLPGFKAMEEAGLSPETITSVKTLAEALLLLTGTELLDQISNMVFGQTNEESFSAGMVSLADGLKAFGEASENIDTTKIQNGIDALMMLVDASKAIPDQEWYVKLFPWGRGDEAVFGEGLASLGDGIAAFATSCADINADSVTGGIDALKALIAASEAVPDADWYTKLCPWGRDDNAVFGNGLSQLGSGISAFATSCADINADSVTGGCDALNALISAAASIPDATWYEKIVPWAKGDEAVFGDGLSALGSGLSAFVTNCGDIDASTVESGASAIVSLAKAANNIPDASWYEKIIPWAESDEEVFGKALKTLGGGLKSFYNSVNSIENFSPTKMDSMTGAITAIVKLANGGMVSEETANKWKTALTSLGDGLYNFYSKGSQIISEDLVAGVDEVFSSVKKVTDMVKTSDISGTHANLELLTSALENLLAIDASSQTITEAITSIANINMAALSAACSAIVEAMGDIASDMVDSFVAGVEENMSAATDACSSLAEACATAISDYDFSGAGKDVVTGFASGIKLNKWIATEAAAAMARAAEKAAKDELDINSPSKVFRAIGTSVPEGFAQGIGKLGSLVRGSARSMANTAVDSVKNTISNLASVVSNDIDTRPTIRPVMDLSDVRLGASAIDSMLNTGSMLGVTANVGSISTMMNRRGQNGTNSDVVSAIDKLNKNLANVGNTSYTVNGITYDDGTNISTAVKDLIRAARIERRV